MLGTPLIEIILGVNTLRLGGLQFEYNIYKREIKIQSDKKCTIYSSRFIMDLYPIIDRGAYRGLR